MRERAFTQQRTRVPELDGLRGLAALGVVIAHYFGEVPHGFAALTLGWVGVDVFFVLSGFLIGSIILEQHDQLNFFKKFYTRRTARIVPVYLAVCVLTLAAAAATAGHRWSVQPFAPWVYSVFGANFVMSATNGPGDLWLRPTWTLDVEEQFYLLLPLIMSMAPKRWLYPLLLGLWASATVFRFALAPVHPIAALTLLPCRMDLLLAGVLLAVLHSSVELSRHLTLMRVLPLLALLALFLLRLLGGAQTFTVFGSTIFGIGVAAFLGAILSGSPEGKRFRSPVLGYFGQISYCLYLVHQPVSGLLHGLILDRAPDIGSLAGFAVSLLAVGISVGIAAASWKWFERPIMRWAQAGRLVATPATAS